MQHVALRVALRDARKPVVQLLLAAFGVWLVMRRRFARNVKYAKGVTLLGLLPEFLRGLLNFTIHDDNHRRHKELGLTWACNLAGVCVVHTIDPKNVQHMLKTNFDNYVKGELIRDPFTVLLGDGIFNVDGDKWYHQRKVSSKMFTKRQFEDHIWKVVQANVQKTNAVLRNSEGQDLCMFNLMNRFTLDTIGEVGFSKQIGSIDDPSSPFLKSFDFAQNALVKRLYSSQSFPTWRVLRSINALWERPLPEHMRMLNEYSESIVDDIIAKGDLGEDNSFVGLFAKDSAGVELRARDEKGFRTFMRDMVLNFLIAGRDTTAQCLTWTLYELAQHPAAVAKIREEVSTVCGDADIKYKHMTELRYVKAAVDEGLRLHPSVPSNVKYTLHADVLPDGTTVPAGTRLAWNPYAQGRCEAIWGADAEAFRPERWMERTQRPSTFEFSAFNAGPRECLGKRLAETEMTAFVAAFVRDFDFVLKAPPQDIRYDCQLTLGCSSGLPMSVTARLPRKGH